MQPPRGWITRPLFQVMFAWQNNDGLAAIELPGLTGRVRAGACDTVKFDLELTLRRVDGAHRRRARVRDGAVRCGDHRAAAGLPRSRCCALVADDAQTSHRVACLLAPTERTLLLETWNADRGGVSQATVHPRAVRGAGAAHAGRDRRWCRSDVALSYARAERAGQPAGASADRAAACGPEERVAAVRGARRSRWWWACWAILKAGGAYVPLDPRATRRRGRRIWSRTAAPGSCCARSAARRLPAARGGAVELASARVERCRRRATARARLRSPLTVVSASGLRHLHLGLHRQAQGGDGRASQLVQPALRGQTRRIAESRGRRASLWCAILAFDAARCERLGAALLCGAPSVIVLARDSWTRAALARGWSTSSGRSTGCTLTRLGAVRSGRGRRSALPARGLRMRA